MAASCTPSIFQGMDALTLRAADGAQAIVSLHGGHVLSWTPAGTAEEQLYMSPRSAFAPGQAIRGGVPVIFPQFSTRGPYPRHGFARNAMWQQVQTAQKPGQRRSDGVSVRLRLVDDAASRAIWPHAFALELSVKVAGDRLTMALHCLNTGDAACDFSCALHTYIRVFALDKMALEGLGGRGYWDAVDGKAKTQPIGPLQPSGEVDRVYEGLVSSLQLRDIAKGKKRTVHIDQQGFEDVVVWNPGAVKCAALSDMPPDGYRQMLCVEAGRITRPVTLLPGEDWTGSQQLRLAH